MYGNDASFVYRSRTQRTCTGYSSTYSCNFRFIPPVGGGVAETEDETLLLALLAREKNVGIGAPTAPDLDNDGFGGGGEDCILIGNSAHEYNFIEGACSVLSNAFIIFATLISVLYKKGAAGT